LRDAGVKPAVFDPFASRKYAGKMPAPRKLSPAFSHGLMKVSNPGRAKFAAKFCFEKLSCLQDSAKDAAKNSLLPQCALDTTN
jgi:hypothetical protein